MADLHGHLSNTEGFLLKDFLRVLLGGFYFLRTLEKYWAIWNKDFLRDLLGGLFLHGHLRNTERFEIKIFLGIYLEGYFYMDTWEILSDLD